MLSTAEGWYEKREGRRRKQIQFVVVVVSIGTANEDFDNPGGASIGYVFEGGRDLDVTSFPSWMQGITSKSIEKSWSGLLCSFFAVRDLVGGERRIVGVRVEGSHGRRER